MGVLEGKSIVITGAGRGLGKAYALHAAGEGANLVINDVDGDVVEETAAEIRAAGGRAVADVCSVGDWDNAGRLIQRAIDTYGGLDGLVNNAGLFYVTEPWDEDPARVRALIEANVLGTIYCGTHALRHLQQQRRGTVINITSGAHTGMSRMAVYGASKGAAASLTYGWALDMQPYNVRVNAVSPLASTRMGARPDGSRTSTLPMPDEVAPLVSFLLSDLAEGITGQIVRLAGGKLCLMSHPAAMPPVEEQADWTVEAIDAAFTRSLRRHLQPVGQLTVPVR